MAKNTVVGILPFLNEILARAKVVEHNLYQVQTGLERNLSVAGVSNASSNSEKVSIVDECYQVMEEIHATLEGLNLPINALKERLYGTDYDEVISEEDWEARNIKQGNVKKTKRSR